MAQFYISHIPVEIDVGCCEYSQRTRQRITITGATQEGQIKAYTGVVQSIEHFPDQVAGRQYCITILEE